MTNRDAAAIPILLLCNVLCISLTPLPLSSTLKLPLKQGGGFPLSVGGILKKTGQPNLSCDAPYK